MPDGTKDSPTLAEALYQNANKTFHDVCDFADYLDKNKHVYWLYGGPDGFVLAYSMLKYIPDLLYNASKTETAKALRDFIYNPWGGAITVAWLASLTLVSAYANGVSKQKDDLNAQDFYVNWQSFRDGTKGLRNAHRGMRSTLDAIRLFSTVDTRYALLPLGLILGIPSMYNRWWNRHMVTIRKRSLDKNEALSKELLNWGRFNDELNHLPASQEQLKKDHANSFLLINKNNTENSRLCYIDRNGVDTDLKLTPEEIQNFLVRKKNRKHPSVIEWQTILPTIAAEHFITFNDDINRELKEKIDLSKHAHNNREACKLSAGFDGFLSGLYLFMGLISLVTLSPEILCVVAAISTLCIITCIFTRLQEEDEFDKLLRISEQKAQLISSIKKFQAELATVGLRNIEVLQIEKQIELELEESQILPDPLKITTLQKALKTKQNEQALAEARSNITRGNIEGYHQDLHKISSISDREAVLIGLRHGLTAHGVLVCGIFAASLISKIFFAAVLPQWSIVACLVLTCLFTIASINASMSYADQYRKKQAKEAKEQIEAVEIIIQKIKSASDACVLSEIENEIAFSDLCDGTPFLSWTLASWLEVLRSTGSGIMKGPKSIDFILLTFFDASSQHDHQHDNPTLSLILMASLFLCAIIWTLRALAKLSAKLREKCETASSATSADNNSAVPDTYPDNPASPAANNGLEQWDITKEKERKRERERCSPDMEPICNFTSNTADETKPLISRTVSYNNVGQNDGASVSTSGLFANPQRSQSTLQFASSHTDPDATFGKP